MHKPYVSPRRKAIMLKYAVVTLCLSLVSVAARAEDEIRFFGTKRQEEKLKVTISEEKPDAITYKLNNRTDRVPAQDVIDVTYQIPAGQGPAYRSAGNKEREADLPATKNDRRKKLRQEAAQEYRDIASKVSENKFAARHLLFKAATAQAKLAADDPAELEPAVEALTRFKADNGDGWQLGACVRLLAGLKEQAGDLAAANRLYAEMAARADLGKEQQAEFVLLEARELLKSNPRAARTKLETLKKEAGKDEVKTARLIVYLLACDASTALTPEVEKQLKSYLAGNASHDVKALACNTLADAYQKAGRPDDAFWQYLWVDAVYPEDREEHAKALYQLSKLFDQVRKDANRAEQCRDRLATDKQFAGTDYQRLAQKDKKASP
jgi:hypothetical protein